MNNQNNLPLKTDHPVLIDLLDDELVFNAIAYDNVNAIYDMVSNEINDVKRSFDNTTLILEYVDNILEDIKNNLPSILLEQVNYHIGRSLECNVLTHCSDYRKLVITMLVDRNGIPSFSINDGVFKIVIDDFKFGRNVITVKYDQDEELQELISIITNEDRKILIEFIESANINQLMRMKKSMDSIEESEDTSNRNFCTD